MDYTMTSSISKRKSADLLLLPYWQKERLPIAANILCAEFSKVTSESLSVGDFTGKEGEVLFLYSSSVPEKRIILVGLGDAKNVTMDSLRISYASAIKACGSKKISSVNVIIPECVQFSQDIVCRCVTEGIGLTAYRYDKLKSKDVKNEKPCTLNKVVFLGIKESSFTSVQKASILIDAVNFTRDLVNGNADEITPGYLGKVAKSLEKESKHIKTTVFHRAEIEKQKMGLLAAVSRGSATEPSFSIIEYKGNPKSSKCVALIGKGVTYDTGGLNLKPTGGMETMKCDMAGGAAVLGTMKALANLKLKVNVVGIVPSTENAVGPLSFKPGDVYQSYSGMTVEIGNTDAEGRLILADAISYANKHFSPKYIIDIATLTGAIVLALGEEASGFYATDDVLADLLTKAGEETHECLWRMPLYPAYKDSLHSSIADMKNWAGRTGGPSVAATFLKQFAKDTSFAHVDVAGTAYLDKPKAYHTTLATGVGVRLFIDFLEKLEKSSL